ncbi:DHX35, partial [Symbiodinium sp. CCMP2456]
APLTRLLLLSAEEPHSCAAEAAAVCAMLSLQAPWLPSQNKDRLATCKESFAVYEGDLVTLLNIYRQYETYRQSDQEWAKRHLLNAKLLDRALRVKQQLGMYLS